MSSFQVVLLRTIDVLNTMVECTSDFLAQRMKRDVYPFLHEYLEKHRATSQKGGPMYRFSPTCKVQTRILRLIGNVVQRLGLSHEDLWKIASACYGYLDCRQPLEIQIVSKNGFFVFTNACGFSLLFMRVLLENSSIPFYVMSYGRGR